MSVTPIRPPGERQMMRFSARMHGIGDAEIRLNDMDITAKVRAFTVRAAAGDLVQVDLTLNIDCLSVDLGEVAIDAAAEDET